MAGDWIKWTKGFARKPEIVQMADLLELSRQHIASAYMEVAEWLDSEGIPDSEDDPDSDITVTLLSRSQRDKRAQLLSHLDDIARVPGIGGALQKVGWLEVTQTALVFKRAARHNTETSKRRALASRRQRRMRSSATSSVSRFHRDKNVTREEKRREEKKEPPVVPLGRAPRAAPEQRVADPGTPPELLALIDGWNALGTDLVGSTTRRDPPAKAVLRGWARLKREPELAVAFQDTAKILDAIRAARFCHGQPWFRLPWLFGSGRSGEFNVVKLLEGAYRHGRDAGNDRRAKRPALYFDDEESRTERMERIRAKTIEAGGSAVDGKGHAVDDPDGS